MNKVILFKTSKGYMFSPIFQCNTEEIIDEYEKKARENYTVEYTKRFKSLLDLRKYVKKELEI